MFEVSGFWERGWWIGDYVSKEAGCRFSGYWMICGLASFRVRESVGVFARGLVGGFFQGCVDCCALARLVVGALGFFVCGVFVFIFIFVFVLLFVRLHAVPCRTMQNTPHVYTRQETSHVVIPFLGRVKISEVHGHACRRSSSFKGFYIAILLIFLMDSIIGSDSIVRGASSAPDRHPSSPPRWGILRGSPLCMP